MGAKIDMIGRRFGRLIVIKEAPPAEKWSSRSLCKCDCGKEKIVRNYNLRTGTKSCGCIQKEVTAARSTKHGFGRRKNQHPIYLCWKRMTARCRNKNASGWEYYGGKGIRVCSRWKTFKNFADDMLPTWVSGLSIERKKNAKGYSKSNCTWGDSTVQNRNKTNARLITYKGETLNASVWAERLGGNMDIIYVRLKRGWTPQRAVSTPVMRYGK